MSRSSVAWIIAAVTFVLVGAALPAQQGGAGAQGGQGQAQRGRGVPIGVAAVALPDGPIVLDSAEQHKIRVVVVTKALSHPWGLAFLPDGNMLVTERGGRLRIIRNGVLDPQPVAGVPKVHAVGLSGLLDIALHPQFAENRFVYLTYSKPGDKGVTVALARGRFDGSVLTDVKDVFVAEAWNPNSSGASRIAFARDGTIFMTTGAAGSNASQDPTSHGGKVLRLRDDGTVPPDNPFVSQTGYKPEIYALGIRNSLGLVIHPETGAVWENENGPNGGDEINIILPGRNYGWPVVSYGRKYEGPRQSEIPWVHGFEQPLVFWVPSIAISGMTFYTGDKFPTWKGNVIVGGMREGEIPRTGHIERIVFNEKREELRREKLLTELKQRIRDVRQGPDGFIYVLTEENEAALLRIEPAPADARDRTQ